MAYLLLACQLSLAMVLLLAATGKALSSAQFLAAIRLSHVPETLVLPTAVLVPATEVCLAVALVVSPVAGLLLIFLATLAVLVGFTAWMIWVHVRGLRLRCGCFGTGNAEIGPSTILRNVLLIAACLIGVGLARPVRSPIAHPSLWLLVSVLGLGMCLALVRAFLFGRAALVLTEAQREALDQKAAHGEGSAVVEGHA